MTRARSCAVAAFVMAFAAASAQAYLYVQSGVESNLLVFDGKVLFTQADGSLTLLDLRSGRVIQRGTEQLHIGQLRLTEHGIIAVSDHRGLYMLNKDSLAVIWKSESGDQANVSDERLVCCDDEGLLECRQLQDGKVVWAKQMGSWLRVLLEGDKVLVSNVGPDVRLAFFCLLDLDTGDELFRKAIPEGVQARQVFFDGQRIYLGVKLAAEAPSDKMQVFDLMGNEHETIDVPRPPGPRGSVLEYGRFTLGNRVYSCETGWVLPASQKDLQFPPYGTPGLGPERPPLPPDVEITLSRNEGSDVPISLAVRTPAGTWQGVLPYLMPRGSIEHWTYIDGKILLGSTMGHLECVDAATGRSLWMYLFPTLRQTMSYTSPGGMPPHYADAAALYRQDNRRPNPPGIYVLPADKTIAQVDIHALVADPSALQHPPVIRDPAPVDLFPDLSYYLTLTWSLVLVPVVLWGMFAVLRWKVHRLGATSAAIADLLAAAAVTISLYMYGRISSHCSLAGKVVIILLIATALYHAVRLWRRQRLVGRIAAGLVLAGAAILGYYAMPIIRWA